MKENNVLLTSFEIGIAPLASRARATGVEESEQESKTLKMRELAVRKQFM